MSTFRCRWAGRHPRRRGNWWGGHPGPVVRAPKRPTRASDADHGVRPTIESLLLEFQTSVIGHVPQRELALYVDRTELGRKRRLLVLQPQRQAAGKVE